jgi:hypothetical protein
MIITGDAPFTFLYKQQTLAFLTWMDKNFNPWPSDAIL